jgi:hypothetical protein
VKNLGQLLGRLYGKNVVFVGEYWSDDIYRGNAKYEKRLDTSTTLVIIINIC